MKKQRKRRAKIFALNFKAEPELLSNLEQVDRLVKVFKEQLLEQVRNRGYKAVDTVKLRSHEDLKECLPINSYRVSVKSIYVGKKKAREGF